METPKPKVLVSDIERKSIPKFLIIVLAFSIVVCVLDKFNIVQVINNSDFVQKRRVRITVDAILNSWRNGEHESPRFLVKREHITSESTLEAWSHGENPFYIEIDRLIAPTHWEFRTIEIDQDVFFKHTGDAFATVYVHSSTKGGIPVQQLWRFTLKRQSDGAWAVSKLSEP